MKLPIYFNVYISFRYAPGSESETPELQIRIRIWQNFIGSLRIRIHVHIRVCITDSYSSSCLVSYAALATGTAL
jgi:hypothetical protein